MVLLSDTKVNFSLTNSLRFLSYNLELDRSYEHVIGICGGSNLDVPCLWVEP